MARRLQPVHDPIVRAELTLRTHDDEPTAGFRCGRTVDAHSDSAQVEVLHGELMAADREDLLGNPVSLSPSVPVTSPAEREGTRRNVAADRLAS